MRCNSTCSYLRLPYSRHHSPVQRSGTASALVSSMGGLRASLVLRPRAARKEPQRPRTARRHRQRPHPDSQQAHPHRLATPVLLAIFLVLLLPGSSDTASELGTPAVSVDGDACGCSCHDFCTRSCQPLGIQPNPPGSLKQNLTLYRFTPSSVTHLSVGQMRVGEQAL